MKKKLLLLIMPFIIACNHTPEVIKDKTIIPVGDAVGTGKILNLSDYAKSIEYIPLETEDSILLGNITYFIYEKEHFILNDFQTGVYQVFDKDGTYKNSLGKRGHGPGEYTYVRFMSYIPETDHILLHVNTKRYYLYDLKGNLIGSTPSVEVPDKYADFQTIGITNSLFLTDLVSPDDLNYRAIIWGKGDWSHIYTKINNPMQHCNIVERPLLDNGAYIWRFKDDVRYYREETDTIYTVNSNMKMEKAFILDLGEYKRPLKWILKGIEFSGQYENVKSISIFNNGICESSSFIFFNFFFGKLAPEAFKELKTNPRNGKQGVVNNFAVNGLFNKKTGEFTLLNQPVKHKYTGFRNDLDGGPCFWPQYISSDNKMVACYMAENFLEIYKTLPDPSPELKKIADKLTPEDNPVFMVVTLK